MIKFVKGVKNPHNGMTYGSNPVVAVDPLRILDLEQFLNKYLDTDVDIGIDSDMLRNFEFANRLLRPFGFELVYWQLSPWNAYKPIVRPIKPISLCGGVVND